VRRALGTAGTFLRVAVLHELQYRVNFYLQLVQSLVAAGTALAVLALVFGYTPELAGWSRDELLVVLGVHVLLGGVIQTAVQPNMTRLLQDIRQGTLDFALTKPLDAQWLVSTRELQVWHLADVAVGSVLVVVGAVRVGGAGPLDVALFALTLMLGTVMIYCAWLAVTVTGFWAVRMDVLVELFDGLYQAGRWPVTIYPGWLRVTFTFLVPLAFAVTVPAQALTQQLGPVAVLAAAALAALLVVLTRLLWLVGLRHYSGASA
jgi:ABC-2 type transport system permease protein